MALTVAQVEAEIAAVRESIRILQRDIADIGREQVELADRIRAVTSLGPPYTVAQTESLTNLRASRRRLQDELASSESQLQTYQQQLQGLNLDLRNAQAIAAAQSQPTEPPAPQTAAVDAQSAAPIGPTAVPPQVAQPATGQVTAVPPATEPTNAVVPSTTNTGGGDQGTNPPVKTLAQTQATSDVGVDANGNNIGLPLRDQTGAVGQIRRNPETGELYDSGAAPPPTSPGIGAQDDATGVDEAVARNARDDADRAYGGASADEYTAINAAISSQNTTTGSINTTGDNLRIIPQPNILDRFSSYTYRASWYIMTPDQYRQLVVSKKKQVNGYMLLMQSAGAPPNTGGARGASAQSTTASGTAAITGANEADAGRNPFFPDDFYFDSITVENLLIGAGSRAAHSVADLKFTVVEPANITLLDRLYEAVQDFMPASGQKRNINYTAVTYLMVIRFYGYDENGNLVTNIGAPDKTGKSDPNAVIEKFIPFKIRQCNWGINNSLVTYSFEAKPPGLILAAGTRRGTIPYDIQLTAKSIGELLGGEAQFASGTAPANAPGASTTASDDGSFDRLEAARLNRQSSGAAPPAPPNANAAPTKKTLAQGLMGAMNAFQQELVKNGTYEFADTYKIVFATGGPGGGGQAIEKAKLIPPGTVVDKKNLPTAAPATSSAQSAEMSKIAADVTGRNYSITAGMQIVQAIDLAIRNSEYIYAQQLKYFANDNNDSTADEQTKNGTGKDVTWYNITFEAVPKPDQYDNKRNDYAYDITFVINTYTPMNFASNFFPINKFKGLHKKYDYWFTGKNTAVLEYQETLNNLYNLTISGSADQKSLAQRQAFTSSMRDQPYYTYQSASTESRQGVSGKENEPGSNLAEYLYDPVGLADSRLKIVGDPAWLQQGSFSTGIDPANFQFNAFMPDGTINFDARDIMFEIAWQRPQDFDINTGLADPYAKSTRREPIQSRVYTAKKVTSEFSKGSFIQYLEGKLYFFMKPNATNKAASAPMPNTASASTERASDTVADGSFDRLEAARLAQRPAPDANLRGRLGDTAAAAGAAVNGAVPVTPVTAGIGSGSPGVFNAAPPGPSDTVQPSPPPSAPTSGTGQSLDVADPFVPPGSLVSDTTDTSFNRLEAARLSRQSPVEAVVSTPQDIVRDY
jgi:hypothetical protein